MADKKESGGGFDKTTDFKWFGIGLLVFLLIWVMPTPESMLLKAKELFGDLSSEEIERKAFNMKIIIALLGCCTVFFATEALYMPAYIYLLALFSYFLELQSQKML